MKMPSAFQVLCTAPLVTEEDASHDSRVAFVNLGLVRLEDEVDGLCKATHHLLAFVADHYLIGRPAIGAVLVLVHDLRAEVHQPGE